MSCRQSFSMAPRESPSCRDKGRTAGEASAVMPSHPRDAPTHPLPSKVLYKRANTKTLCELVEMSGTVLIRNSQNTCLAVLRKKKSFKENGDFGGVFLILMKICM